MVRCLLTACSLILVLAGCQPGAGTREDASAAAPPVANAADATADARFADLSQRWLDAAMRLGPVSATQIGDHRFDAELDDLSATGRAARLELSRRILAELEAIDAGALSRANQVDAALLRNQLRYDIWDLETMQSWAWDPQVYSQLAGGALYGLMARDFAPLPERLRSATARMQKLPALFAQAHANLVPERVPKIHAETVAKQNRGLLSLVDGLIVPHADALAAEDRARLEAAIANLRAAVEEHQAWLDDTLVPNASGNFRIGAERYDEKLAFALNSPLDRAEIRSRAEAELARVRSEMYAISRDVLGATLDGRTLPATPAADLQQAAIEAALERAYAERPARDEVMATAEEALARASAFVRDRDLVTMPETPVRIITMPEFQRGVALAYCDPPGPLDRDQPTFYAVSPIPDDWTEAQVTSFLREYNTRSIHELTIHEAMPGHYLQLAHANRYPSALRAVLYSGPFVEGWAVYAEKMMANAGYLGGDPLYKLINLKWDLRVIGNALIDQAIQVDGMTREQAMEFMTRQTFQEEREAAGKWVRAQLTSAQLPTYFVGYQEHMDLRREAERRAGADFDLKRYHDTVLSFGSPPVRYARALMFDEPIR